MNYVSYWERIPLQETKLLLNLIGNVIDSMFGWN